MAISRSFRGSRQRQRSPERRQLALQAAAAAQEAAAALEHAADAAEAAAEEDEEEATIQEVASAAAVYEAASDIAFCLDSAAAAAGSLWRSPLQSKPWVEASASRVSQLLEAQSEALDSSLQGPNLANLDEIIQNAVRERTGLLEAAAARLDGAAQALWKELRELKAGLAELRSEMEILRSSSAVGLAGRDEPCAQARQACVTASQSPAELTMRPVRGLTDAGGVLNKEHDGSFGSAGDRDLQGMLAAAQSVIDEPTHAGGCSSRALLSGSAHLVAEESSGGSMLERSRADIANMRREPGCFPSPKSSVGVAGGLPSPVSPMSLAPVPALWARGPVSPTKPLQYPAPPAALCGSPVAVDSSAAGKKAPLHCSDMAALAL